MYKLACKPSYWYVLRLAVSFKWHQTKRNNYNKGNLYLDTSIFYDCIPVPVKVTSNQSKLYFCKIMIEGLNLRGLESNSFIKLFVQIWLVGNLVPRPLALRFVSLTSISSKVYLIQSRGALYTNLCNKVFHWLTEQFFS